MSAADFESTPILFNEASSFTTESFAIPTLPSTATYIRPGFETTGSIPSSTATSDPNANNGPPIKIILPAALCGVVVLIGIGVAIYIFIRRRKRKQEIPTELHSALTQGYDTSEPFSGSASLKPTISPLDTRSPHNVRSPPSNYLTPERIKSPTAFRTPERTKSPEHTKSPPNEPASQMWASATNTPSRERMTPINEVESHRGARELEGGALEMEGTHGRWEMDGSQVSTPQGRSPATRSPAMRSPGARSPGRSPADIIASAAAGGGLHPRAEPDSRISEQTRSYMTEDSQQRESIPILFDERTEKGTPQPTSVPQIHIQTDEEQHKGTKESARDSEKIQAPDSTERPESEWGRLFTTVAVWPLSRARSRSKKNKAKEAKAEEGEFDRGNLI